MMNNTPDRCSQLRKLHEQLTSQVKTLRESMQQAEENGVANPVETLNTLKTLQASLRRISQQLEGCPPLPETVESSVAPSTTLQQQAKAIQSRNWFLDAEQHDELDDSIISLE